jgi:hypothetical protein
MLPSPKSLLGVAAAVLAAVFSLELTVRVDDWAQFGVPLSAPAIGIEELAIRDSLGFHARAGTAFRQFHINSQGFRGPELKTLDTSSYLVVTAGASETFGLYETAGKEWPRQFADSLAGCAANVQVANAAFAGMSLPTVRQDFERRVSRYSPDMVVYYPTPMQYLYDLTPSAAPPTNDVAPPLSSLRSRALPRFRDAAKRGMPQPALDLLRRLDMWRARSATGSQARNEVEPERLAIFERDLRELVGAYRAAGAVPVLVVHANRFADTTSVESRRLLAAWERFYPRYTGLAIVRFDRLAAERTIRVAKDSGLVAVDPRAELLATQGAFNDFSHFNDAGSAVIGGMAARAVAPIICSPAAVPPTSAAAPR